jgi:hypothetical protein
MKSIKKSFFHLPVFLFFILFILNPANTFSQRNDIMLSSYWDFYSNNYLSSQSSSRGFAGIAAENDLSGTVLNPAALTISKKWNVYAEYTYKSNMIWLRTLGFPDTDLKQYHPSLSAGVGYKINDYFSAGLMYYNSNSHKFSYELVRTNEFGEIIGTYDEYDKASISNISMPLVFNYKGILKVGLSLNYSFFHRVIGPYGNIGNEITYSDVKANFQKFYPQAGIVVSPVKQWSIGFVFKPEFREKVTWTFPNGNTETNPYENIFPMHIGAGTKVSISKINLNLYADYNFYQTSVEDIMKDRHNFNAGAEYLYNKNLILRLGFFTMLDNRNFKATTWLEPEGKYTQYFLTAGTSFTYKKLTFSVAFMDSHILSTGLLGQTLLNAGISANF